jgi:hypothetical protein
LNAAALAAISALVGVVITALGTAYVSYSQRTAQIRNEHKLRAFERHLHHYERIFSTARSAQDALNDYAELLKRAAPDDPLLRQTLSIAAAAASEYSAAVDWRHNAGMAYLELRLEEQCLQARDLLINWIAHPRVGVGNVISIKHEDKIERISSKRAGRLEAGSYSELRIQRRTIVTPAVGDERSIRRIDTALSKVIIELKEVLAY